MYIAIIPLSLTYVPQCNGEYKLFMLAQIKKKAKSEYYPPKEIHSAQGRDLTLLFWDFSQSEKLFEIKPPLVHTLYVRKFI